MPEFTFDNPCSRESNTFKVIELSNYYLFEDKFEISFVHSEIDPLRTEKCGNCGSGEHIYLKCHKPKTQFCYGYNCRNVIKPNFPRYKSTSSKDQKLRPCSPRVGRDCRISLKSDHVHKIILLNRNIQLTNKFR